MTLAGKEGIPDYTAEYEYVPIMAYSFFIFGAAACVMPYFSWWLVPGYRNLKSFERFDWNSRILSNIHAVIACGLGLYNILFDVPTWEDRIWGMSFLPRAAVALTTGYITADLVLMLVGFPFKESLFYICHHLAVIIAYSANVIYGPLLYFTNIRILAELSTPFVNARWMMYILGHKDSKLYLYNGFVMLGTFFAVRIGILPFFYYMMLKSFIVEGFRRLPLWMSVTCLTANLALDVINIYWFMKMARGAYKMLKKAKVKSDQTENSHVKAQ